jgi:hypothetical protein
VSTPVAAAFFKGVIAMKTKLALMIFLGAAAGNALACYTVYDRSNAIVYYAQTPPVDMTPPFNDRLQQRFPGSHMVFGSGTNCPAKQAGYNPAKPAPPSAPLFTDRQTAEDMKLAHTVLPNGSVVVSKPPANMKPGFTVMNLGVQGTPSSAIQAAPARRGPVITEMKNPPVTVIQKDGSTVTEIQ